MRNRWAKAFTIVELLIVITVIAILAVAIFVGYTGIQKNAQIRAAQSDLSNIAAEMQRSFQQTGAYPSQLPSAIKASNPKVILTLKNSGTAPYYTNLTPVQNGVLLSNICNDLITEGVGNGTDQGGTVRDYIQGCGQWNNNSMQVTAWDTRTWSTPVTEEQLRAYITNYTVSNAYHKATQEATVKNFYTQFTNRFIQQGGSFPITTFWDAWANSGNGGVIKQELAPNPPTRPYYCAEASINASSEIWHVDQSSRIESGTC